MVLESVFRVLIDCERQV
jgi:hypothetical protein